MSLRTLPPNAKVFCTVFGYAGKTGLRKGLLEPQNPILGTVIGKSGDAQNVCALTKLGSVFTITFFLFHYIRRNRK